MGLTITVNISDADQVALENDLLDTNEWVQAAVTGKINACRKRMALVAVKILTADPDVTTMPASDADLIAELVKRSDYKKRIDR